MSKCQYVKEEDDRTKAKPVPINSSKRGQGERAANNQGIPRYAGERKLMAAEVCFRKNLKSLGVNRPTANEIFRNGYSNNNAIQDLNPEGIKSFLGLLKNSKHHLCPNPKEVFIRRTFGDQLKLFVTWIEFQPILGATATKVDWIGSPTAKSDTLLDHLRSTNEDNANTAVNDLTLPDRLTTMCKGVTKTSLLYTIRQQSAVEDHDMEGTVGLGPRNAYADWTEYAIRCRIHYGSHWSKDNNTLWGILFKLVGSGPGWSYIQSYGTEGRVGGDGRDSKHFNFDRHKRLWHDAKQTLPRHKAFPPEDQFVYDFCRSLQDARLEHSIPIIITEGLDYYANFERALVYLTRALGVKKLQGQNKRGQNVSAFTNNKKRKGNNKSGNSSSSNKQHGNNHDNSGTKAQQGTYKGSVECKFYPREVWLSMSQDQQQTFQALKQANNTNSGGNKQSKVAATAATPPTNTGPASNQFGCHSHIGSSSTVKPGQCELDSHADTTAAGSNMVLLGPLDSNVALFSDAYSPMKDVPIAPQFDLSQPDPGLQFECDTHTWDPYASHFEEDEEAANASFPGVVAALSGGGPMQETESWICSTNNWTSIGVKHAEYWLSYLQKICTNQTQRLGYTQQEIRDRLHSAYVGSTGDGENLYIVQILANSTKTLISLTNKEELAIQKEAKAWTKERKSL
eukprot:jgi/Psemu1/7399/gm1.7399_g